MTHTEEYFEVIIIGGSYSGLAAGMALGRALRRVLIIDSAKPCNAQTPYSHNFLTQDGKPPAEVAALARAQVEQYQTVSFVDGVAVGARKTEGGFEVALASGHAFSARKLIFATGIKDRMPDIEGYAESWGISVLHCPYCHGYEVRKERTGVLANGADGFEFTQLISNWTGDLALFTNGPSVLTAEQMFILKKHNIAVVESPVAKIQHARGYIEHVELVNGTRYPLKALYARSAFDQHCAIPQVLGCEVTKDGYIQVDALQETTVAGVFACGDNSGRMRSIANAVATGTMAGAAVNRALVQAKFMDG